MPTLPKVSGWLRCMAIACSCVGVLGCQSSPNMDRCAAVPIAGPNATEALARALAWIARHPATVENDGLLGLGEEILALDFILQRETDDDARPLRVARDRQLAQFAHQMLRLPRASPELDTPHFLPIYLSTRSIASSAGVSVPDLAAPDLATRITAFATKYDYPVYDLWNKCYFASLTNDTPVGADPLLLTTAVRLHSPQARLLWPTEAGERSNIESGILDICHEVFAITRFGRETVHLFNAVEAARAAPLLSDLLRWSVQNDMLECVAELVTASCLLHVAMDDDLRLAVIYLCARQRADGSFVPTTASRRTTRHSVLSASMALASVQSSYSLQRARHD